VQLSRLFLVILICGQGNAILMNILVVHEKNWRAKNVYELHGYSESLSLRGHNVFAIEYDEVWQRGHLLDFGNLATKRFDNVHRSFDDASVTLVRPGAIKVPGLSRLSAALTFLPVADKLIKQARIDAILMYSVPTYGLQTILLAHKHSIPVLFRAVDVLPLLVPYRFLRYLTLQFEKAVYPNVDKILALTPRLKRYVVNLGADEKRVELLLPGVRLERFAPRPLNKDLMAKWGIEASDKVVLHMGRTYTFGGLDLLIKNFGQILARVPQAKLLLVGRGELLEDLRRQAKETDYGDRIIFTGFQPFELMPDFINMSAVCTIPFRLCEATIDIIPTKILEYLACGVPVVSTAMPGTVEILPDEHCGVVYANSEHDLIDKILVLLLDDDRRKEIGLWGLAHVRESFAWDRTIDRLEENLHFAAKAYEV
jgi:glycosyltransferase involved in cell wall biosynthesis